MKDITLHIALRPYLAEWLTTRFGAPVSFPPRSYENLLLHHLVVRGRVAAPRLRSSGADSGKVVVSIRLTDSASRRPEYWHTLTRRAAADFAQALERLFRLHLWQECSPLLQGTGLNAGLNDWCQRQGIKVEHREGVRQKFYRMRKAYAARGIDLGQKRCHEGGKK